MSRRPTSAAPQLPLALDAADDSAEARSRLARMRDCLRRGTHYDYAHENAAWLEARGHRGLVAEVRERALAKPTPRLAAKLAALREGHQEPSRANLVRGNILHEWVGASSYVLVEVDAEDRVIAETQHGPRWIVAVWAREVIEPALPYHYAWTVEAVAA